MKGPYHPEQRQTPPGSHQRIGSRWVPYLHRTRLNEIDRPATRCDCLGIHLRSSTCRRKDEVRTSTLPQSPKVHITPSSSYQDRPDDDNGPDAAETNST
jgi:hypothetical protein